MVAVRFRGLISLIDDPGLQMEATVTVGERSLAIAVDRQELGAWKLGKCKVEGHGDAEVLLTVGGDRITFRPSSPEEFLEVVAEAAQPARKAEPVAAAFPVASGRHRPHRGRHRRSRFRTSA